MVPRYFDVELYIAWSGRSACHDKSTYWDLHMHVLMVVTDFFL